MRHLGLSALAATLGILLLLGSGRIVTPAAAQILYGGLIGNVTTQIVNFCIIGQNDTPEANPDTATTPEDTPLTVDAANGLLGNDVDVDGDDLTVTEFTVDGQSITVDAAFVDENLGELTKSVDVSRYVL